MNKRIKKEESRSLSDQEVLDICNHQANLITYDQLQNYNTLDEVLGPHKACIILYETRDNYGHWVCIYKDKNDTIHFFDSYGLKPDDEIKFVPKNFREYKGMDYPHLSYLIYQDGNDIDYNEHKLQSDLRDANTCGRWVGSRLLLRDMPPKKFVKTFTQSKKVSPDWLVTKFTESL